MPSSQFLGQPGQQLLFESFGAIGQSNTADHRKPKSVLGQLDQSALEIPVSNKHPQTVRSLKIEAEGDYWRGSIKPKIRLQGRWLELAGFSPGHRVQVTCVAPGVIELRAPDTTSVNCLKQTPPLGPEVSI